MKSLICFSLLAVLATPARAQYASPQSPPLPSKAQPQVLPQGQAFEPAVEPPAYVVYRAVPRQQVQYTQAPPAAGVAESVCVTQRVRYTQAPPAAVAGPVCVMPQAQYTQMLLDDSQELQPDPMPVALCGHPGVRGGFGASGNCATGLSQGVPGGGITINARKAKIRRSFRGNGGGFGGGGGGGITINARKAKIKRSF